MLRPATEQDAEMVLRWRNHPDVREMSVNTDQILPNDHTIWWSQMLQDPDTHAVIYEIGGYPAGVVVFTGLAEPPPQWSFYLDVDGLEERGHKFQAWLRSEREVLDFAFGELGLSELEGVVLGHNSAMRQLHARHGFVEVRTESLFQEGELRHPEPVQLVTVRITPEARCR